MYASLVSAAPVIGTFHAFGERSRLYDVAAPLLRGVSRHLAVRIAVSEAAAGFAASRIGGTFEIVPNGVDVARFRDAEPMSNAPPRPVVLFVGRLEPRKGVGVMLEAFRLSKGGWNLLVVGDGSGRSEIDALPAALAARVRALGAVENETLPSCHASADVLVAPSLGGESFGMVITEGMAAGLGIVASDIPGYREVVGEAGILVPPGDAPALAEALDRACSDPDLLTRLGSAARQRASEFSWDVVAARLEQIYAEVSRVA
jgi:phosphatidylinositol alpha-mannosyltransferase